MTCSWLEDISSVLLSLEAKLQNLLGLAHSNRSFIEPLTMCQSLHSITLILSLHQCFSTLCYTVRIVVHPPSHRMGRQFGLLFSLHLCGLLDCDSLWIEWDEFNSEFLNPSTLNIWGGIILCWRACPVHCRVLSSIAGLYPLDISSSPPPGCDSQKCLQTLPMSPGGQNHPKF